MAALQAAVTAALVPGACLVPDTFAQHNSSQGTGYVHKGQHCYLASFTLLPSGTITATVQGQPAAYLLR